MIPFRWVPRMVGTGLRIPVESTKASVVHVGRSAMDVIPTYKAVIIRNTKSLPDFLHTAAFVNGLEHITEDTRIIAGHEFWPKLYTASAFSRMIWFVGSIHLILVEGEAVLILGESGRRGRGYREIEAMRILNIIILPPPE